MGNRFTIGLARMRRAVGFRTFGVMLVLANVAWSTGCDSAGGEADEAEIARIEFGLRKDEGEAFITSGSVSLRNGVPTAFDTLHVTRGEDYVGEVRFFDEAGSEVRTYHQRAEAVQVFYALQGLQNATLHVIDRETDYGRDDIGDNLRVGLRFELSTQLGAREERGELRVRLVEFQVDRKNGTNDQGGTLRFDFVMPLVVDPLPGPSLLAPITRAVLTVEATDGSEVHTVTATNPAGLHLGAAEVAEDTLRLGQKLFNGQVRIFDAADNDLTDQVRSEATYYQFVYGALNHGTLDLSPDANGDPFGHTFTYNLTGVGFCNEGTLQLIRYDPNLAQQKGGGGEVMMTFPLIHSGGALVHSCGG